MAMTAGKLAYYREYREKNKERFHAAQKKHAQSLPPRKERENLEILRAQSRKSYYVCRGDLLSAEKEQEKIDNLRLLIPSKRPGMKPYLGEEDRVIRRKATVRRARYRHVSGLPDLLKEPETCEICGRGGKICLDHCHEKNVFRGWICDNCNVAMGKIEENVGTLEAMIKYITKGDQLL